jgi:MHS family citrate/tricarballylate:H+ symporter-like MFS transporter
MFAAVIGYVLNQTLTPADVGNWGWRVPFFIGCMIVPFLFYIRRSLEETQEFLQQTQHPTMNQVFASLGRNWQIVVLGMLLVGMTTIAFYTPAAAPSSMPVSDHGLPAPRSSCAPAPRVCWPVAHRMPV